MSEIIDLSDTVIPKTDQLNYDCLVTGPRTITVTSVKNVGGEQPVVIGYEGDDGRPYKPCLGMRRVLIEAWGSDGARYIGRKMTLIGNPSVKWAGKEQGGIQISHLSHIKKPMKFMLTISRGKREPYTVGIIETEKLNELTDDVFASICYEIEIAGSVSELQAIGERVKLSKFDSAGSARIKDVYRERSKQLREDQ